jgi:multisubunit Na+/H+ antiporter MnhE subunit
MKYAIAFLATWAVFTGLWFLYTSTLEFWELIAGLAAAMLATIAAAVVWGEAFERFSPRPAWLLYFLTEPWYAIEGSWALLRALLRRVLGKKSEAHFKVVSLDAGGDDYESRARRALITVLTTIPPNFVVIGIDRARGLMLIHQVSPTGTPWVAKQLGAK